MKYSASLLVFCLAFFSCRKDEPIPSNIPVYEGPPVYAGIYDTSFYYYEFPVPAEIPVVWDNEGHQAWGCIWLDLYGDSTDDVRIDLTIDHPDSTYVDEAEGLLLIVGDTIQFAICSEQNCYQGSCHDRYSVDTLSYAERIDDKEFRGMGLTPSLGYVYYMWHYWQWDVGSPSRGAWYYTSGIKYFGFQIDPFKYGWVEVEITDPENPKIMSFAVQK